MLEHLFFSQQTPPLCPLSIKLSGKFFVRLLDTNQSRTTPQLRAGLQTADQEQLSISDALLLHWTISNQTH